MNMHTYKHISINHPKNEINVFKDLAEKYDKFGTLYIGVDFDNTLLPYGTTELNEAPCGCHNIVKTLQKAKKLGLKLCLWTLPTSDENYTWKAEWCAKNGIEMDYFNESPLLNQYSKIYGKPHFNLLLDDVAGLESSFSILYNLCEYIESKQNKENVSIK